MPAPKKPRKSSSPKNQYTAELSSSQLVLGISILMIFGLACFLLGVLIGKFDPYLQPEQQLAETTEPKITVTPAETSENNSSATGLSVSAKENTSKSTAPVIEERTIVVPSKSTKRPTRPATRVPESAPVTVAELQPTQTPKVQVPEVAPQIATVEPNKTKVKPVRVKPIQGPASPTPPVQGGWAVQIAAFKDATLAEVERKRLEARLPFKISILKRRGELWNRLIIGNYATESEAVALKRTLINQHKMVDPWLVNRNQAQ